MVWSASHNWIVRNGNRTLSLDDLEQFHRVILREIIPDEIADTGSTLMHFAALSPMAHILVPILHEHGASLMIPNFEGAFPIHWAALNTSCPTAVSTLIKLGSGIQVVDDHLNTPLHYAAECGNRHAAQSIVQRCPAILKMVNRCHQTALSVACEGEQKSMIKFLIAQGSLSEECHLKTAIQHNATSVIRILLEHMGPDNLSEQQKESMLELARKEKRRSALRLLRKTLVNSLSC